MAQETKTYHIRVNIDDDTEQWREVQGVRVPVPDPDIYLFVHNGVKPHGWTVSELTSGLCFTRSAGLRTQKAAIEEALDIYNRVKRLRRTSACAGQSPTPACVGVYHPMPPRTRQSCLISRRKIIMLTKEKANEHDSRTTGRFFGLA